MDIASYSFGMFVTFGATSLVVLAIGLAEAAGKTQAAKADARRGAYMLSASLFGLAAIFLLINLGPLLLRSSPSISAPQEQVQPPPIPTASVQSKPAYKPTDEEINKLELAAHEAWSKVFAVSAISSLAKDISVNHKCSYSRDGTVVVDVSVRLVSQEAYESRAELRKSVYPQIESICRSTLVGKGFDNPQVLVLTDIHR